MPGAAADDSLAARDEERRRGEERGGEGEEEKIAHAPVVARAACFGADPDASPTPGLAFLTPP